MSLKKRMFRANMTILFAALFSLMLIILTVLFFFEDSLENQLYSISGMKIEEHAQQTVRIVERLTADEWNHSTDLDAQSRAEKLVEKIQMEVHQWNYSTAVISGGQAVAGDHGEQMHDVAEFFGEIAEENGQTGIYSFQKATVIGKYLTGCCGTLSGGTLDRLLAEPFFLRFSVHRVFGGSWRNYYFNVSGFFRYQKNESDGDGTGGNARGRSRANQKRNSQRED